jgi:hypothetical protein
MHGDRFMARADLDDNVAAYGGGAASISEISDALEGAWNDAVANPELRAQVAAALGLSDGDLDEAAHCPFRVRQGSAGIDPATAVIVIATYIGLEVFAKAFTDLAREEVKRRIKQAWNVLEPKVRERLRDHHALGERKED